MTIIQSVLKKSNHAIMCDCMAFNKYANSEIDLAECKKLFFRNNKVDYKRAEQITDEMFIEWLDTLGYARGGYDL